MPKCHFANLLFRKNCAGGFRGLVQNSNARHRKNTSFSEGQPHIGDPQPQMSASESFLQLYLFTKPPRERKVNSVKKSTTKREHSLNRVWPCCEMLLYGLPWSERGHDDGNSETRRVRGLLTT